jgi:hypothetical protein
MGTKISVLNRVNFRISTPSSFGDVEMYDDDDDEEEDLDDIDEEILRTIEDELNADDGMLDVDAEGELDPDHIPSLEPGAIAPDPEPPFLPKATVLSPRYPPIPLPFPRLDSLFVPGIGHALSDDVRIGPFESKLSRGRRSRHVINVKGREIVEWKPEGQGEFMGRGTPVDEGRRNDWVRIRPSDALATTAEAPSQDWTGFLDSLARAMNVRTDRTCSFSAMVADGSAAFDVGLPATLTSLLDSAEFRNSGLHAPEGNGFEPTVSSMAGVVVPVVTPAIISSPSSSTLSRALG